MQRHTQQLHGDGKFDLGVWRNVRSHAEQLYHLLQQR